MAKNPARGHNIIAKNVIPNLVGMTRTTAQSLLSSLGFTYTETSENTENEAENNTITAQGVSSGNTELLGTNVPYTYKTFNFTPFGFTPFGAFSFTPFSAFSFTPVAFSFVTFSFTPFGAFGFLNFGFSPSQCVHEDTLIKTPNGLIAAKDIKVGDLIYTVDINEIDLENSLSLNSISLTSSGLTESEVQNIEASQKDTVVWFNNDDTTKFSQEQPIFIKRDNQYGIISSGLIDINDTLIKISDSGEIVETLITDIKTQQGNYNVYSFSTGLKPWYIAGGVLVHTK